MTTKQAFQHLIDNEPYSKFPDRSKGSIASWIGRFRKGELTDKKQDEILKEAGYNEIPTTGTQWEVNKD